MKPCCRGFSSCTTCPECGSRITRERPTRPAYSEEYLAELDRALRARPDGNTPDPAFQEQAQADYYDAREPS